MSTRKHNPQLSFTLRMVEAVTVIGVLYCAVLIASGNTTIPQWQLMLYATWFAVAAASAEAILEWYRVGVYSLVAMTFFVGVVDLMSGMASAGGFVLALTLLFLIISYVVQEWWLFE
ncbi:MAG: hypothetical protein SF029_06905 [bacterium]|nr:hypothetical protein [bacterium]